jgi:hypothetical protein
MKKLLLVLLVGLLVLGFGKQALKGTAGSSDSSSGTTRSFEYQEAFKKVHSSGPLPGAIPSGLILPDGSTVGERVEAINAANPENIEAKTLPDWYVKALEEYYGR